MEGRRPHALDAESGQPRPQLARGLVGEGDRDELRRRERAARHLPRDAAGDRRRLAGACTGEDADRPARRFDRGALLRVQSGKDSLGVHRRTDWAAGRDRFPGFGGVGRRLRAVAARATSALALRIAHDRAELGDHLERVAVVGELLELDELL